MRTDLALYALELDDDFYSYYKHNAEKLVEALKEMAPIQFGVKFKGKDFISQNDETLWVVDRKGTVRFANEETGWEWLGIIDLDVVDVAKLLGANAIRHGDTILSFDHFGAAIFRAEDDDLDMYPDIERVTLNILSRNEKEEYDVEYGVEMMAGWLHPHVSNM